MNREKDDIFCAERQCGAFKRVVQKTRREFPHMKRFFAILMALTMSLTLVACGDKDTTTPEASDSTNNGPTEDSSEWPRSSVEILVPASPGGGTDLSLRSLLQDISQYGDFAVVNNIEGSGAVAIAEAAAADPEELNELLFFNGTLFMNYDVGLIDEKPFEDLIPVWASSLFGSYCVAVPADSPFNSIADVKAYAEEHPGELSFGACLGDLAHLMGIQLADQLGIEWTYVATGTDADRIPLIMGHNLDITIINGVTAQNYLPDDSIKVISLVHGRDDTMIEKMQQVETLEEAGYDPLVNLPLIIFVPKGTSESDMNRVNELFANALENPKVQEALAKLNMQMESVGDVAAVQEELQEYSVQIHDACVAAGMATR